MAAKRSLTRRLALWYSAFVLIASLAVAGWMAWWFRNQNLEEFHRSAETNVNFVSELRLPKSPELADRLAHILGCQVAFFSDKGSPGQWPAELDEVIDQLATHNQPSATRAHNYEIAVAPFVDTDTSLVLFRKDEGWLPGSAGLILAPTLLFTLAFAVLGILIGRSIIRPLGTVATWLPNLEKNQEENPDPLPTSISSRKDEIGALGRALEETAKKLRREQSLRRESERLATLGRIATSLAHEIKNPVAAIGLHADLLAQSVAEQDSDSVQLIREEVVRITDLVNQWLFVAHPHPAGKNDHDLLALVFDVGKRLGPILEHAGAKLEIQSAASTNFTANIDAPRIEQVIRNLLVNASQAMPEGGHIRVQLASQKSDLISVTVEDEGPGFSKAALARFGEAFYSEREGGMGIGLTLVQEVIRNHGGTVKAENTASGACVTIQIPSQI